MSITESLTKLTVPPKCDARIEITPALGRIRVSPYRVWWFYLLFGTYVVAAMLLIMWFKPNDPYLTDPTVTPMRYRLTIAFSALFICGVIACFVFWFMSVGYESIFISKEYLTIRGRSVARIPVAAINGMRNVIGKDVAHFDASEGLFNNWAFKKSPRGSVDVLTADGPVRVLSDWKHGTTRWLADAIATALDKPLVTELVEQECSDEASKPIRPVMFTGWELSLVGLLVAVAVAMLLVSTGRVIYFGSASEYWPTAEGIVQSHRYETWYEWMDKKVDAEVTYTYEVDGLALNGERVWYGFHQKTQAIEALFADLSDSNRVTVYYDPEHPLRSTLVTGYDPALHYVVAIEAVFLLLGLGLLVYHPDRKRVVFTRKYFPKRHKLHFWAPTS
jgi:Protein of unknown function (DUF3592)